MNNQQFFDAALAHIRKQGRPAARMCLHSGENQCQYRLPLPDGSVLSCAIGGQVPDDEYHPGLEGRKIDGLVNFCSPEDQDELLTAAMDKIGVRFAGVDRDLLGSVQRAHDGAAAAPHLMFMETFERYMQATASLGLYGITYMPAVASEI